MDNTTIYITPVDAIGTIIIDGQENIGTVVIGTQMVTANLGTPDITVIGDGVPGPAGPEGPAGDSGAESFTRTAARALSGHRVVKAVVGGEIDYASNDTIADALIVEGITTGAADEGNDIAIQAAGEMTEGSWAWSLGPVYCGLNGVLTQNPPAGAWIKQVAVAVDTTKIIVGLMPTIITN